MGVIQLALLMLGDEFGNIFKQKKFNKLNSEKKIYQNFMIF